MTYTDTLMALGIWIVCVLLFWIGVGVARLQRRGDRRDD